MKIIDIIRLVNRKLAGEQLVYDKMVDYLDNVIDDINAKLNATYPAFSIMASNPTESTRYECFPDQYIRSVVCVGAAYYFYENDEEGEETASSYKYKYMENLFYMQRDFTDHVPEVYQSDSPGGVNIDLDDREYRTEFDFKVW